MVYGSSDLCGKALRELAKGWPLGSFVCFVVKGCDNIDGQVGSFKIAAWFCFTMFQGSNPAVAVFAPCSINVPRNHVTVDLNESGVPDLIHDET